MPHGVKHPPNPLGPSQGGRAARGTGRASLMRCTKLKAVGKQISTLL